ncbi:MAG: GGDEF domain-containing protein [Gammaproteobacteria bacterium]|nr:GGDEF domain-containing protein [Gammaproteobacteria bacterium]
MEEILVEQLMSTDVPIMDASQPLALAVREMSARSLSCMILLNESATPVGIITERDMISIAALALDGKIDWHEPAADHMSARLIYLRPEQSLFEALVVARAREVRHLPVLGKDNKLAGIVTATEMVRAHFSVFESLSEAAEKTVAVRRDDFASVTARLRTLSLEDPLLGIGNRRALDRDMEHIEGASRRYQHVYSVAMFDVDRFKAYNDRYGHPAGDRVLREIVTIFSAALRSADRLFRYGGEEILLLMPETDLPGAMIVADRLRESLEVRALPHEKSKRGVVTVSGGVAEGGFRHEPPGWEAVVHAADRALYKAKKSGRNRVISSTD